MDGSVILGLTISAVDAAIFVPQAVRAYKFRNDPVALRGISTVTIWIVLFVYSAWISWDMWTGRWDAHAYVYAGIPAAIFILAIIYRSRKLSRVSSLSSKCPTCGSPRLSQEGTSL